MKPQQQQREGTMGRLFQMMNMAKGDGVAYDSEKCGVYEICNFKVTYFF